MFDAVSNVVIKNGEFEFEKNNGILIYKFGGKNESNRALGSGIYQAILTISSQNGDAVQTNVIPVKVGIKK